MVDIHFDSDHHLSIQSVHQHYCYLFLDSHTKMRKYKYIYSEKIQKIIGARKGCWNAEKMPKFVEEIQKCKRLKFDSESPVDNEDSIGGRKVQNQMFMDSIKFYPRFN